MVTLTLILMLGIVAGATGAFLGNFISGATGLSCTFGNDGNMYVLSGRNVIRYNGTSGALIDTFLGIAPAVNLPYYVITAPDTPEPTSAVIAGALIALISLRRRR